MRVRTGRFEKLMFTQCSLCEGAGAGLHHCPEQTRLHLAPSGPFRQCGHLMPFPTHRLPGITPSRHDRRMYDADPRSRELRGRLPARPGRYRLVSGSCSSARSFAPRFLPTLGRPHAVALRFTRRHQLVTGLAPVRVRPCWAHQAKRPPRKAEAVGNGRCEQLTAGCRWSPW